MTYAQKDALLQIDTPFGKDAVLLVGLRGEEQVSGLFRYDLDVVSPERALDFKKIVGKGVTAKVRLSGGGFRIVHGLCTRFRQGGRDIRQTFYHLELRPWLWMLTKTSDCRIFQDKSTPEILKALFDELGFADHRSALKQSYDKREYCVQYRETAFDFVSRLLEDEGIHYYFEHAEGKHTLVLADDSASGPPCPDLKEARYRDDDATSTRDEDVVTSFEREVVVVSGGFAHTDYDFEAPSASLLSKADGKAGKLKQFEYPGGYRKKAAGDKRAKLRIEAEEVTEALLAGRSYCRTFVAGYTFKLTGHDRADMNGEYVLERLAVTCDNEAYQNSFEAAPKSTPFRPARVTPRPVIPGAQTAVVIGKSGEEIWTDKYGRVMVQFPWDRIGKKDDKSSCWLRVAQGWAGKGWGMFFLPRIGQEVLVTFLDGDPDRPIVTGSVYNAEQKVPYGLPGAQTKSTIFGHSSKEGEGGNEIRFEDKKDAEEIYVFAQKDLKVITKNDYLLQTKGKLDHVIKGNHAVKVEEGDQSLEVSKGNRKIDVTKGNEAHSVKGTRDLKVDGDETHANKGAFTHTVKGNYTLKIDGDLVIEAKSVTVKAKQAVQMKSGTDFKVEAGTALDAKAGTDMKLKGGVNVVIEGGVGFKAKGGAMAEVKGGGMLTLKGGLVKIN